MPESRNDDIRWLTTPEFGIARNSLNCIGVTGFYGWWPPTHKGRSLATYVYMNVCIHTCQYTCIHTHADEMKDAEVLPVTAAGHTFYIHFHCPLHLRLLKKSLHFGNIVRRRYRRIVWSSPCKDMYCFVRACTYLCINVYMTVCIHIFDEY